VEHTESRGGTYRMYGRNIQEVWEEHLERKGGTYRKKGRNI